MIVYGIKYNKQRLYIVYDTITIGALTETFRENIYSFKYIVKNNNKQMLLYIVFCRKKA